MSVKNSQEYVPPMIKTTYYKEGDQPEESSESFTSSVMTEDELYDSNAYKKNYQSIRLQNETTSSMVASHMTNYNSSFKHSV